MRTRAHAAARASVRSSGKDAAISRLAKGARRPPGAPAAHELPHEARQPGREHDLIGAVDLFWFPPSPRMVELAFEVLPSFFGRLEVREAQGEEPVLGVERDASELPLTAAHCHRRAEELRFDVDSCFFTQLAPGGLDDCLAVLDATPRRDPDRRLRIRRIHDPEQQHAAGVVDDDHPRRVPVGSHRHRSAIGDVGDVGGVRARRRRLRPPRPLPRRA